ncbi:Gti1/Pac2 family-domain-containing protein [Cokeromyces recurvatus]|uniref:Gti1/Pac2 family-domain-containing protein n=1 Tax=Cokeromyces recurvatus TaxID=90255 RepID=UPI002220E7A2|nr:Gti1/Pac2 family-domain-containing protein [Cokeromyces recurvatus]KAI7908163.1 Gti1/Pac2 family-domain-containing protein [Cokeromyces recurvatus]
METFIGYIKTPQDALIIFEACRRGMLNRVQRRLTSKERISIQSGSVFAWDEREAGMRRWTDGRTWSPSRVLGSFLTYKELDTKRRPRRPPSIIPGVKHIPFSYKHDGLIKQSFSICTTTNQKIHLISYYTKADVLSGRLKRPSEDPRLSSIDIPRGLYPELNPLVNIASQDQYHPLIQRHNSIDSNGDLSTTSSVSSTYSLPPSLTITNNTTSPSTSEDDFETTLSPLNTTIHPKQQQQQQQQQQEQEHVPFTSSSFSSTSLSQYNLLPIQDIAWEKLPSTEDIRQLNALRDLVRI